MILESITRTLQVILVYVRENPTVVLWCIRIAHVILFERGNRRDNPTTMGIILKWIKETLPIINVLVYGRGNRDIWTDILMFIIWINRTAQVLVLCAGRIDRTNPQPLFILFDWNIRIAYLILSHVINAKRTHALLR